MTANIEKIPAKTKIAETDSNPQILCDFFFTLMKVPGTFGFDFSGDEFVLTGIFSTESGERDLFKYAIFAGEKNAQTSRSNQIRIARIAKNLQGWKDILPGLIGGQEG